MTQKGVVEYFGEHEGYRCGYCKSSSTSYSHGMWGHYLTPLDYQNLIDRGWRRSGKYCYKPMMNLTCCPQYTIRCEALNFKPSRSQKKVLKRMNKFLAFGQAHKADSGHNSFDEGEENREQQMDVVSSAHVQSKKKETVAKDVAEFLTSCDTIDNCKKAEDVNISGTKSSASTAAPSENMAPSAKPGNVSANKTTSQEMNPDHPRCRKAKEIRKEKRIQKLLNAGYSMEEVANMPKKQKCAEKMIEDFIFESMPENPAHRLELRLVPCDQNNPKFSNTFEMSYAIYQKYQMTIHKDPPEKCSQTQFIRFLVNNPFQTGESTQDIGFGSYHQQYWLDDKLIAVGVLDILPYCISSVYLYYDPNYSFLSLGTYASLREIAFTRELHRRYPELMYYYMGFYIHSCPKMKYKGSYSPSFLLCPETYIFHPIEKCIPKLEVSKYHRLEEDSEKIDVDGVVQLSEVLVLYKRQAMNYTAYLRLNKHADDEDVVQEYANLVGRKCYRQMLLYRS